MLISTARVIDRELYRSASTTHVRSAQPIELLEELAVLQAAREALPEVAVYSRVQLTCLSRCGFCAGVKQRKGRPPPPAEELAEQIARRVRWLREMKGLKVKEIEQRAGLSHSAVSRVERGLRGALLPLDTVVRLAWALEVDLAVLIFGNPAGEAPADGSWPESVWLPPELPDPKRGRPAKEQRRPPVSAQQPMRERGGLAKRSK
ncbi:MAG TPA: helix-turn-helix transcriptional regulator [Polyangiaceae bacterium]|nr:helix-turn-helix transcriptional regulator [Polyangiaceae bacterium]